jgi:hypothetical protein
MLVPAHRPQETEQVPKKEVTTILAGAVPGRPSSASPPRPAAAAPRMRRFIYWEEGSWVAVCSTRGRSNHTRTGSADVRTSSGSGDPRGGQRDPIAMASDAPC